MPVHPQGRDITCTPAKTNQKRIGGKTRKVPYKDETKRCEYDKTFKQKRRSEGWTNQGLDMRLTEIEVETAQGPRDQLNEVVAELDVCQSDLTYGEAPDYRLQVAQQ